MPIIAAKTGDILERELENNGGQLLARQRLESTVAEGQLDEPVHIGYSNYPQGFLRLRRSLPISAFGTLVRSYQKHSFG